MLPEGTTRVRVRASPSRISWRSRGAGRERGVIQITPQMRIVVAVDAVEFSSGD